MTDPHTPEPPAELLDTLRGVLEIVQGYQPRPPGEPLAERLSTHLGTPVAGVAVIAESVPAHRYVDHDIALEAVAAADPAATVVGVGGHDMRNHMEFADMLQQLPHYPPLTIAPPDLVNLADGPDSERSYLAFGIRLFAFEGHPVAVLLRAPNPRFGREAASLEVLCADREVAGHLLAELRRVATQRSVLRGQVITLTTSGFEQHSNGVTFVARPDVDAEEVILPEGTLQRLHDHVLGSAALSERLRAHRQHLKRGVLLYGPPGSGKTHSVRHLIGRSPEHTVLILTGDALRAIGLAAGIARALQPAIVVLEDCDLIASGRDMMGGLKPLLFEVLDAMDGLDPDADVTFLLTTNRVDEMEHALTQRPGRVDLAVEIPLPDTDGRRPLLRLYAPRPATFSAEAIEAAADATHGTTASFARELIRQAVLTATLAGEEPGDAHLAAATSEMLASAATLARLMSPPPGAFPGSPEGWPGGR